MLNLKRNLYIYLPFHLLGEYNKDQSTASHLFLQLDIYSRKISCSFDFAVKRRNKRYTTTRILSMVRPYNYHKQ